MRKWSAFAALGAWLSSCSFGPPEAAVDIRDRGEFVRAIAKIQPGMTKDEVISILGQPDDVQTQSDPPGIGITDCSEILGYGSAGHLACATLGSISLSTKGTVQHIWGNSGQPPPRSMFSESELRRLISVLHDCAKRSSFHPNGGQSFDPGGVIRAANSLLVLGKEKALAVIREAARVSAAGGLETFLVLRLIFATPDDPGYMPKIFFGAPDPPEPKDPKRFPIYPIVLIDDIPFLPLMGYSVIGLPEPIDRHVDYFSRYGTVRQFPLVPTSKPLEALRKIEEAPFALFDGLTAWQENELRSVLRCQLLRLLKPVFRTRIDLEAEGRLIFDGDMEWKDEEREVSRLKICWNPMKNTYYFLDGTALEQNVRQFRRMPWKAIVLDTELSIVVERKSENSVNLMVEWSMGRIPDSDNVLLKVFRAADRSIPIMTFDFSNTRFPPQRQGHSELIYRRGSETICSSTVPMVLKDGEEIRLEILSKGEIVSQTTIRPQ